MRYEEHSATGASARFVKCFWSLTTEPHEASEAATPILPDGRVELLLSTGDDVDRTAAGLSERQPVMQVAGQLTTAVHITPRGRMEVLGVRLHPWAAGLFLRLPMHELRDRMLPADQVPVANELLRSASCAEPGARLPRLREDVERYASQLSSPPRAAIALAGRLMAGTTNVTIRALADSVGLGTRRVQGLFADHVGVSPRTLARIARLQRALGLARANPRQSLSAVAHDAGYYDHAHFVRDCQDIAGESPSAVLGRDGGVTAAFLDGEAR
jgi:AraC-like DNA-binding protein